MAAIGALMAGGTFLVGTTGAGATGPSGVACTLAGSATITPGLGTTAQNFTFGFSGNLTNCNSTDSTIKSGTVTASGTGNGTCGNSTASGSGTVTWNNGQTSSVNFAVNGAAASVTVQETVTAGEFNGDQGVSELAFQPAAGQNCATVPVSNATFNGPDGVGTPN